MKKLSTPLFALLCCLACVTLFASGAQVADEDFVNPNDLLNFDVTNVRMKNKKVPPEPSMSKDEKPGPEQATASAPNSNDSAGTHRHQPDNDHSWALNQCQESNSKCKKSFESGLTLLRQHVKSLVRHLEPKIGSVTHEVNLDLRLKLSYHQLSKLREFGEGHNSDVHDVFDTLGNMVLFASELIEPETYVHWLEVKMGLSSTVLTQILLITVSILAVLTMLPRVRITWGFLGRAWFFVYVVSVVFTWIEMYQKEVANQEKVMMEERMKSCPNYSEMSTFSRLTSYITGFFTFQKDECQEFYQTMMVNPFFKVSPIEAVAVAVVKSFVAPLGHIGKGIKTFVVEMFSGMPLQYQLYLMIGPAVLLVIALLVWGGYHLNIAYLIQLGPARVQHAVAPPPQVQPAIRERDDRLLEAPEQQRQPTTRQPRALPQRQQQHRPAVDSARSSQTMSASSFQDTPLASLEDMSTEALHGLAQNRAFAENMHDPMAGGDRSEIVGMKRQTGQENLEVRRRVGAGNTEVKRPMETEHTEVKKPLGEESTQVKKREEAHSSEVKSKIPQRLVTTNVTNADACMKREDGRPTSRGIEGKKVGSAQKLDRDILKSQDSVHEDASRQKEQVSTDETQDSNMERVCDQLEQVEITASTTSPSEEDQETLVAAEIEKMEISPDTSPESDGLTHGETANREASENSGNRGAEEPFKNE